jgi:phenylalanyl-tRNA synthetase beta chain
MKDLSLIVEVEEPATVVENNVMKAAKKALDRDIFIESTNVFDVYSGQGMPEGTKNIGVTISYRSDRRTLTDSEIQTAFNAAQHEIEKLYKIRKQ